MMWKIVEVFKKEQNHFQKSTYYFNRTNCPTIDTLPNEGKGNDVLYTGMTWSGFRPSDDRCLYGYLVPSNMMAVCALKKAAQIVVNEYGGIFPSDYKGTCRDNRPDRSEHYL